ncbi:MAG: hypothetical protein H7326_01915 [Bdellovibrionaceae bacterium]|nr:hypothetical protein [Pseudobdellovibrionaceae bacterium]
MNRQTILKLIFFVASLFLTCLAYAGDLSCACRATGPGYEEGVNVDKICSYNCDCGDGKLIEVLKVKTTASSLETWDIGNHICHGQYAYRPSLDSPNWQIQVRFSSFTINGEGRLGFEDSTEIASGIFMQIRRTKVAPEILEVLRLATQR